MRRNPAADDADPTPGLDRRRFLGLGAAAGGAVVLGSAGVARATHATAAPAVVPPDAGA